MYVVQQVFGLFGASEAKPLIGNIKLSVIDTDKDISEDPKRSNIRGKVNAHESTKTNGLASLRYL